MSRTIIKTGAILGLLTLGGAAAAQSIADQVIPQLQAEGYTRIEVKNGPNQVKVEAIRGGRELEVIYDARTGRVLKQEVNRVGAGDDTRPGIEISQERRDFVAARNNDDDDPGLGGNGNRFEDDDDDDEGRGRGRGRGRGGDRADSDDGDDDRGRGRGRGRGGDRDRDGDDRDDDDDDDDDDDNDDD